MSSGSVRNVACVVFALAFIAAWWRLPVLADEAYYWTWSQSLATRYFDHPPGIAWVLAGSRSLFGDSQLGLRMVSLLSITTCAAFGVAATHRFTQHGSGATLGFLLLCASPMFVIGFLPATHDVVLGAVLAVATYALVRALEDGASPVWSFGTGLLLTLSIGLKHYAALVALGVLIGAAFSVRGRKRLCGSAPWVGVAAGAILLAPWGLSEIHAQGGSLSFQARRVLFSHPWRGVGAPFLMTGSLLVTLGPVAVLAGVLAGKDACQFRLRAPFVLGAYVLLAGCLIAVIAGSGEANWAMPALVVALPALVSSLLERPRWLRWLRPVALCSAGALVIALVHVAHPFLPMSKDPTQRGVGYEKVAGASLQALEQNGGHLIITRTYQAASLLRFHTADEVPVYELGRVGGRRSQYDLWPKPVACPSDRAVLVLPTDRIPSDLPAEVIGPKQKVVRHFRKSSFGPKVFWVTPIRLVAGLSSTDACAASRGPAQVSSAR